MSIAKSSGWYFRLLVQTANCRVPLFEKGGVQFKGKETYLEKCISYISLYWPQDQESTLFNMNFQRWFLWYGLIYMNVKSKWEGNQWTNCTQLPWFQTQTFTKQSFETLILNSVTFLAALTCPKYVATLHYVQICFCLKQHLLNICWGNAACCLVSNSSARIWSKKN